MRAVSQPRVCETRVNPAPPILRRAIAQSRADENRPRSRITPSKRNLWPPTGDTPVESDRFGLACGEGVLPALSAPRSRDAGRLAEQLVGRGRVRVDDPAVVRRRRD